MRHKNKFAFLFMLIIATAFILNPYIQASDENEGQILKINVVEEGNYGKDIHPNYLVFSEEESFLNYYSDMKGLNKAERYNPGINFDFNMGVIITAGEVYKEGYEVKLDKVTYKNEVIKIYVNISEPKKRTRRTTQRPYIIASVYNNKKIRMNAKLINFIDNNTNERLRTIPVVSTKNYPYYDIPEQAMVYPVESGDYGNVDFEAYGAFGEHLSFDQSYIKLKENKKHKVRPPRLNFLGNVVIMMTMGEQQHGGYEMKIDGAYTNVYTGGKDLYVMVKKIEPNDNTIRYYDITRPYLIASIQIGIDKNKLTTAHFINEETGELLVSSKIKHDRY